MPASQIGKGRRLDQPTEITRLAKKWGNCLATYADRINDGRCAIYLWEDPQHPAAFLVRRDGRLGWFVDEIKGPQNAELESHVLHPMHSAFAQAGVETASLITAVHELIDAECLFRRDGSQAGDEVLD